MEVLLDVDDGNTENIAENIARADSNVGEAPTEQKTSEERVQAIVEKFSKKPETTIAARRIRVDLLMQASIVYHFDNICKRKKASTHAFGFSKIARAKQVRGYVLKKQEIMGLFTEMQTNKKSLRSRKQVHASGVSAAPLVRETSGGMASCRNCYRQKNASSKSVDAYQKNIAGVEDHHQIEQKLEERFSSMHCLKFVRQKRSLTITGTSSFHTFTQALHEFINFEFVGDFDQDHLSFNGELVQMLVLAAEEQLERTTTFSSTSARDSKRFFTYLPLIVVRADGEPVSAQPLPICIFREEGNVLKAEEKLYDPGVRVFFQKKAVVDQNWMAKIHVYWEKIFWQAVEIAH